MKSEQIDIEYEKKQLVLARFNTLNPESKILLGGSKEMSVKQLIQHIEKGDDFGKHVVQIQIKMLQLFSEGVKT
ncbi:hypothetical protein CL622_04695 [archaeon]|nr:hypothetical protein [archaeon]